MKIDLIKPKAADQRMKTRKSQGAAKATGRYERTQGIIMRTTAVRRAITPTARS